MVAQILQLHSCHDPDCTVNHGSPSVKEIKGWIVEELQNNVLDSLVDAIYSMLIANDYSAKPIPNEDSLYHVTLNLSGISITLVLDGDQLTFLSRQFTEGS